VTALLAALAVGLGVVAQFATGFGFSVVCAPFLIAAYRAPNGIQLILVLSMVVNLAMLTREHRGIDLRAAGLLLVPAMTVAVPVAIAVRNSRSGPLTVVAGVICLAGVATLASGRRFGGVSGRAGTVAVGAISGGMNAIAGMSGPPVALFAVNARWPVERARPTMQVFFLGLNVVTLAALGWPDRLPFGVVAAFAVGVVAGALLAGRLPAIVVRAATLALAGVGSVLAIVRGLTA
jgi:hypothetical protein